jgi:hypothetical protein
MTEHPKVENAPGLTWRDLKGGREARWLARSDIAKKGFRPRVLRIWFGETPTPTECLYIASQCRRLQSEMLVWNRGGLPKPLAAERVDTIRQLVDRYKNDPDCQHRKNRIKTRLNYERLMRRIVSDHGDEWIENIRSRHLLRWYELWVGDKNQIPMAHSLITMLRTLIEFGAVMLEDEACAKLDIKFGKIKFKKGKKRTQALTAEQAVAIRAMAHKMGRPSIALAQAIQFEVMLRQKDVIGEWVPLPEPGTSDVVRDGKKWLWGIRWSEVDQNLILTHQTSKRDKKIEFDLKEAPMVMEELSRLQPYPASGPVIVSETTGCPYSEFTFRDHWRRIADACGVPKTVYNMDSRAGAISEANAAGAPLGHTQEAATHSDPSTTGGYIRSYKETAKNVTQLRAKHRAKKTEE